MAGGVRRLDPDRSTIRRLTASACTLFVLMMVAAPAAAQALYKYRGENGEWIYSDRPPDDGSIAEIRQLESAESGAEVSVSYEFTGSSVQLVADNQFHAPIELALDIEMIRGLRFPDTSQELRWVLPPRSETTMLSLDLLEDGTSPLLEYRFTYLAGDPDAEHRPSGAYRAPFALATDFPVSQAYPDVITHTTRDSYHAVDLAMPIGTDIFAARDGIVFDVAANNYRSGLDPERDGPAANVIRILHDDGTYAIYAHLNLNSIRVRRGDRVRRGQYIADSGNTGFSSGPHLHFAVVRNVGLRIESVPVMFQGANTTTVTPATGLALTAY